DASPPRPALKIAKRIPEKITAMIGATRSTLMPVVYGSRPTPFCIWSYIWSFTWKPNDCICWTCCSRVACLPASVVIGRAVKNARSTEVRSSMPTTFGDAATAWNVSLGDRMMPMNRAARLFEAGVELAGAVVLIQFVRERPDCTTAYTSAWDEMFPDPVPELSRGVRFTESNGTTLGRGDAGACGRDAGAARRVCAQSAPPIAVRAAGRGGAFTGVADDGTAPFWNPAGLASGSFVGLTVDGNALDRQSGLFLGLATPPLGVCYYRE